MTDSGFHITPVDIRSQQFHRSLRGYAPAGVEEFRERVGDELERLLRERAQMEERLLQFRDQLTLFREREKALNEALVAAQQLRADTEQAARREADLVLREARSEADRIVQEALANVVKHARARSARVLIERRAGKLHVTVEDNGCGAAVPTAAGDGHYGLDIMRERAQRIGGELHEPEASAAEHDSSTAALIARYRRLRG